MPPRPAPFDVIQFPKDLGTDKAQPHYMVFSTHAIRGTVGASGSDNSFGGVEAQVALPVPTNPTASYEQGWDTESAGMAMSGVITGAQDIIDAYNAPTGRGKTEGGPAGIKGAMAAVTNKLKKEGKTIAAGGVLGNVGNLINNRALGQATGTAVFDQSFAVYGGPAYRTFSFSFSLMPLNRTDVDTIKSIVDFFKINAAPEARGAGSVARVYGLPKAFWPRYYTSRGENQYINKIGKCALTNIQVTYGGERFSTFDNLDAPVQVDISLSFKELQLQDSAAMRNGY